MGAVVSRVYSRTLRLSLSRMSARYVICFMLINLCERNWYRATLQSWNPKQKTGNVIWISLSHLSPLLRGLSFALLIRRRMRCSAGWTKAVFKWCAHVYSSDWAKSSRFFLLRLHKTIPLTLFCISSNVRDLPSQRSGCRFCFHTFLHLIHIRRWVCSLLLLSIHPSIHPCLGTGPSYVISIDSCIPMSYHRRVLPPSLTGTLLSE